MNFSRFLTLTGILLVVADRQNITLECADVSVEMSEFARVGQSLWSTYDFAYAKNATVAFEVVQGDRSIFTFAEIGSETKLVLANQLKTGNEAVHHFTVRAFTNEVTNGESAECFSILTVTVIPLSWHLILSSIFIFIFALICLFNFWIFRGGWNAKYEI